MSEDRGDYEVRGETVREATTKRRMPENLRRFLIRMQGGKMYLPAAFRIVWFRDECSDWGIETKLIEGGQEAGFATVQARIVNPEGRVIATGIKTETKQDFPAGWVEKSESGAISRALAVAGFGTQFASEIDAGEDNHPSDTPQNLQGNGAAAGAGGGLLNPDVWEGPGQCPRCHAPEGRKHGKPCTSGTPAQAAGR